MTERRGMRWRLLAALVVGALGAQVCEGCSCSPLARVEDPLGFMPGDTAVLVEMDVGAMENDAVFRKLLASRLGEGSCLASLLLDGSESVSLGLPDVAIDETTVPRIVLVLREGGDLDASEAVTCLAGDLLPEGVSPSKSKYRGVRLVGHPVLPHMELAVAGGRTLLIGDPAGIRSMIDTVLDGKSGIVGDKRFRDARKMLPKGAQVRVIAFPGKSLRASASSRLHEPFSSILDSGNVIAGVVLSEGGVTIYGRTGPHPDAEVVARSAALEVEAARRNKLARLIGASNVLGETSFMSSGEWVLLEARAGTDPVIDLLDVSGNSDVGGK